jgi:tetratricopeptide (TPR) repeat protein
MRVLWILACVVVMFSCKSEQVTEVKSNNQTSVDPILAGMIKAAENAPNDINILLEKAAYLYKNEQYELALQDIQKAISIDSINWDFHHFKADILLDYYKSKEAVETLENVLEKEPTRIPTLLKLAEFHHILKDYNSSISSINEVIRLQSYNPEAFFMLGMNFRAMDQLKEAKGSFLRAVELDADLTDAWILLGNIAEEEKDSSAENFYQNAVRSDPESIEALHSLAYYLQNQDRVLDAIELYRQINVLDTQYEDAYLNTGILYISIDSLAQAKEHFQILKKINPANPFGYYYSGLAEEYAGNPVQAQIEFENALRIKPDYQKAAEALAKY